MDRYIVPRYCAKLTVMKKVEYLPSFQVIFPLDLLSMMNILIVLTILIWLAIPLIWIPLHLFPAFFRKHGKLNYVFSALCWAAFGVLAGTEGELIVSWTIKLPRALATIGMVFVCGGIVLQIWTLRLLTFHGIAGMHELNNRTDVFQQEGAFAIVRHPTYLAHTIILLGIFFITRSGAIGAVVLLDAVLVHALIIPLEERELINRFGSAYADYRIKVPKFFPTIRL